MPGIHDHGGERLTNVGEPTNDDHAATKAYCDANSGGGGALTLVTKTLTNAQTLALPTTAVTILAAPGENTLALPMHAWLHTHWVADYTNIDAGAILTVGIAGGGTLAQLREAVDSTVSLLLAGGGPDGVWAFLPSLVENVQPVATGSVYGISGFYDSDLANKAIVISADNNGADDFEDGDTGNTLTIGVLYQSIAF